MWEQVSLNPHNDNSSNNDNVIVKLHASAGVIRGHKVKITRWNKDSWLQEYA